MFTNAEAGVRKPIYPGVPLHSPDELVGLLDDVVRVSPCLGKVVVEPAVLWPPPPLVLPPVEADGGLLDPGGEAVEAGVEHLQDVGHRQVLAPGAVAACKKSIQIWKTYYEQTAAAAEISAAAFGAE